MGSPLFSLKCLTHLLFLQSDIDKEIDVCYNVSDLKNGRKNMDNILYIIGQAFGVIAIILGFVSYQMRTQRQILFVLSATAVVFVIHYFLIGAYTAMAMNAVNIFRNIAYDYRARKGIDSKVIPIIFACIQAVMGIITWEAWYSVFVLLGIVINTVCVSFKNPQNVRKSILVTSPLVLTYDIFATSLGGAVYESVALVSAAIGIFRNRKKKEELN